MAKMIVRNYFKENAAQNKCENVGVTLDGFQIWTVDGGEMLAVLHEGLLFRVVHNRHLEALKSLNLMERVKETVEQCFQRVTAEGSKVTFVHSGPAEFELAGRLPDWYKCREVVEARKEAEQVFKLERDRQAEEQAAKAQAEALDKAQAKWMEGKSITAEDFEGLLARHGVKVPPKTMGWIRKALYEISQTSYSREIRYNNSTTVMTLAKSLTEKLSNAQPVAPVEN